MRTRLQEEPIDNDGRDCRRSRNRERAFARPAHEHAQDRRKPERPATLGARSSPDSDFGGTHGQPPLAQRAVASVEPTLRPR